jgi:hypothetical protein
MHPQAFAISPIAMSAKIRIPEDSLSRSRELEQE